MAEITSTVNNKAEPHKLPVALGGLGLLLEDGQSILVEQGSVLLLEQ